MPTAQDNIDFMRSPNRWPMWPRLPIKKGLDVACLVEIGFSGVEPIVYHGSIYGPLSEDNSTKYKSFEDLVADGWVVD